VRMEASGCEGGGLRLCGWRPPPVWRRRVNLLPVRPMKGSAAPASRCLRSPLFGELTWVNWPRKSWEEEEEEEEEEVWPKLQSSPSQPEEENGNKLSFFNV